MRDPSSTAPVDRFDRDAIRAVVDEVLARGGGWLTPTKRRRLLIAAGIPIAAARVATSAADAVSAAAAIGFPVALKALGPTLLHKTERGAVRLNLDDEAAVRAAYEDLAARLGTEMTQCSCSAWCRAASR